MLPHKGSFLSAPSQVVQVSTASAPEGISATRGTVGELQSCIDGRDPRALPAGVVCQQDKGMAPTLLPYAPGTRINYKPIESVAANW